MHSAPPPVDPETEPAAQAAAGADALARALLFNTGMVLSTIVFAIACVPIAIAPYGHRYRFIMQWTRFNLWWLGVTCNLHHIIEGAENIPDEPVVILCKHQSAWETLVLASIINPQAWVLKRELLWIPFFGWGLALLKPIAINRSSAREAMRALVAQGRQRLAAGISVVVFPEGTRTTPGERIPYRRGGAELAAKAGVKIIPIAHNSGDFWPRRSFAKRPGTIRMVVGTAIEPADRSAKELTTHAETWIEETVAKLRRDLQATKGLQDPQAS